MLSVYTLAAAVSDVAATVTLLAFGSAWAAAEPTAVHWLNRKNFEGGEPGVSRRHRQDCRPS